MTLKKELSTIDVIVLFVGIGMSFSVGIYYAFKERNKMTPYRYHRGGGKLKALPVALSMLVTYESSIFFLGYPAEVYLHGFKFWLFNVSTILGYTAVLWISVPLFYKLQVTSVFEYLQMRHGSLGIRQMATCLSLLYMSIYAGIVIFGAAIAVESVTNIPFLVSVFGLTGVAVIYTALGGLKAVVATDFIQGIVMIVSILALLIRGTLAVGGIGKVIALNEPSGRMQLVDFDLNPHVRHTFWSIIFGGTVRFLGTCCRQPTVQRLNSTASISEAKKVVYMSLFGFFVLQILVMTEGLVAYAYFSNKGCDPLASGEIKNPNQIISYAVLDMFQTIPGVAGLFLAALCCASLSTLSSLLSSVSAIVVEDIVKPKLPQTSNKKEIWIAKALVIIGGAVCIAVAIIVGKANGPMTEIAGSILSAVDSPMVGLFGLSIFVSFTTRKGLVASVIVSLAAAFWLSVGYNFSPGRKVTPWLSLGPTNSCDIMTIGFNVSSNSTMTKILVPELEHFNYTESNAASPQEIKGLDNLYSVSYMYFAAMVLCVSLIVGLIVSKLTQPSGGIDVPEHLMLVPKPCRKSKGRSEGSVEVVVLNVKEDDKDQVEAFL